MKSLLLVLVSVILLSGYCPVAKADDVGTVQLVLKPEPGSLGLLLAGLAPMFFVLFLRSVAPDSNVSRCVRSAGP